MDNQGLDDHFVQRCRSAWWTVYVLDRQMSSLMGVPLGVRDEDVRAVLPTFSGSSQRTLALEIHVKLSRIISQILNSRRTHPATANWIHANFAYGSCLWPRWPFE